MGNWPLERILLAFIKEATDKALNSLPLHWYGTYNALDLYLEHSSCSPFVPLSSSSTITEDMKEENIRELVDMPSPEVRDRRNEMFKKIAYATEEYELYTTGSVVMVVVSIQDEQGNDQLFESEGGDFTPCTAANLLDYADSLDSQTYVDRVSASPHGE